MLKGISEYQDKRIEKNASIRELIDNGFVGSGETSGLFSIVFFLGFISSGTSRRYSMLLSSPQVEVPISLAKFRLSGIHLNITSNFYVHEDGKFAVY